VKGGMNTDDDEDNSIFVEWCKEKIFQKSKSFIQGQKK